MIAVSACLIGENVKYNGQNNYNKAVIKYLKGKDYITICPETYGMLPIPRLPSEIKGDKVINKEGKDVTDNFNKGALKALQKCIDHNVTELILKANSPSCGYLHVYDGTFTSKLVDKNGIFVEMLLNKYPNIKIYTEKDIERMMNL